MMRPKRSKVRILVGGMFIAAYISALAHSQAPFLAITIALTGYLVNQPDDDH
ncbi:MAG: hypothetical protein JWR22_1548 [Herminiimonas sp.]|nr:hypothetical protein [Herminiimonas sp.]